MTSWAKRRVVVEISVADECVSEADLRWAVEWSLKSHQLLDIVLRSRAAPGAKILLRNVRVKQHHKIVAASRREGVPRSGADAFAQGWSPDSCPWPRETPESLDWIASWHTANAAAYRSHVEGR